MRKFVLLAVLLFAAITVVWSNEWTLDSVVKDELNGLVKRFHSRDVSIIG